MHLDLGLVVIGIFDGFPFGVDDVTGVCICSSWVSSIPEVGWIVPSLSPSNNIG